jgi:hypothetical protein
VYPLCHSNHIYDIDSESLQGHLIYIGCFAITVTLWFLAVGLYHVFSWVINWATAVSGHLHSCHRGFWSPLTFPSLRPCLRSLRESAISFGQKWTLSFRRFGWRSLGGYADPETPLLSRAECPHTCQTTSKLCQECFRIVEKSRLLSGTFYIFTPRTEWYKWDIPARGSEFAASRRSCQLCHILWNSLQERTRLTLNILTRDLANTSWLWVSIWKDGSGRCCISLFDDPSYAPRPENRHSVCKSIEIREGSSASRESCSWLAGFYRVPQWSISLCSNTDLDRPLRRNCEILGCRLPS